MQFKVISLAKNLGSNATCKSFQVKFLKEKVNTQSLELKIDYQ